MKDFIFSYKKFFIFITVLLLSITFVSKNNKLSDVSAAEKKYTVNTADLNVRVQPDSDSEILTVLDKSVVVTVIGTEGSWSEIILPEADNTDSLDTASTGYVKSKYLTEGTTLKKKKVVSKGQQELTAPVL